MLCGLFAFSEVVNKSIVGYHRPYSVMMSEATIQRNYIKSFFCQQERLKTKGAKRLDLLAKRSSIERQNVLPGSTVRNLLAGC